MLILYCTCRKLLTNPSPPWRLSRKVIDTFPRALGKIIESSGHFSKLSLPSPRALSAFAERSREVQSLCYRGHGLIDFD